MHLRTRHANQPLDRRRIIFSSTNKQYSMSSLVSQTTSSSPRRSPRWGGSKVDPRKLMNNFRLGDDIEVVPCLEREYIPYVVAGSEPETPQMAEPETPQLEIELIPCCTEDLADVSTEAADSSPSACSESAHPQRDLTKSTVHNMLASVIPEDLLTDILEGARRTRVLIEGRNLTEIRQFHGAMRACTQEFRALMPGCRFYFKALEPYWRCKSPPEILLVISNDTIHATMTRSCGRTYRHVNGATADQLINGAAEEQAYLPILGLLPKAHRAIKKIWRAGLSEEEMAEYNQGSQRPELRPVVYYDGELDLS
jgi:hypothetical protein